MVLELNLLAFLVEIQPLARTVYCKTISTKIVSHDRLHTDATN